MNKAEQDNMNAATQNMLEQIQRAEQELALLKRNAVLMLEQAASFEARGKIAPELTDRIANFARLLNS